LAYVDLGIDFNYFTIQKDESKLGEDRIDVLAVLFDLLLGFCGVK